MSGLPREDRHARHARPGTKPKCRLRTAKEATLPHRYGHCRRLDRRSHHMRKEGQDERSELREGQECEYDRHNGSLFLAPAEELEFSKK